MPLVCLGNDKVDSGDVEQVILRWSVSNVYMMACKALYASSVLT